MTSLTIPRSSGTIEMAKAPRTKRPDEWSDEHTETVRSMWGRGCTASQIGRVVGRSRNAVIGKIHRMGLPTRSLEARRVASREYTPRPPRPKRLASIKPVIAYDPSQKRETVKMEYPEPIRIHTMDIGYGQCRRPLWPDHPKPSLADMYYCGLPTRKGSSYRFCAGCAPMLLVPIADRHRANVVPRYQIRRAA